MSPLSFLETQEVESAKHESVSLDMIPLACFVIFSPCLLLKVTFRQNTFYLSDEAESR